MEYVKLKAAMAAAERKHGLQELDYLSKEILTTIAAADLMGMKIRVSDIKNQRVFGTLPTVITRLNKLEEGGWINRQDDKKDGRVTLFQITSKARTTFSKISSSLKNY